jgi:ribosomal protein S18 acetylase RimI-like enzyme
MSAATSWLEYRFREGTQADQAACYALLRQNMQPYFDRYGLRYSSTAFEQAWAQGSPSLLTCQDAPIGFTLTHFQPAYAFLHTVQIAPRHRMRGLGTLLMHHFAWQSWQRGQPELRLVVYADNPAWQWYQRLGYRAQGPVYVQTELGHTLQTDPGPFAGPLKAVVKGLPWTEEAN